MFFYYELKCFIVIELKVRKLKGADIGKIKLYMNYIDSNLKKEYVDESIRIILCKEVDEIVVKYVTDDKILFSVYQLNLF